MRRSVGALAGIAGLAVIAAACATDPGVRTSAADLLAPPTTEPEPADPLDWSSCPDIDLYDVMTVWECTWVDVPMDRRDPSSDVIQVALTRPVLDAGDERRPLVVQPGGPGASGVTFAWTFNEQLPVDLLDRFYPVGWDPRGIGLSRPAIDCGGLDAMDIPDPAECMEQTGDLLGFVGAADAALDLEQVRVALGVERLDYLGYSYGTALGAVYAMAHPERVGRFVLDGAIDPQAGDPTRPEALDGVPVYAADELDAVVARFHELCDATAECAAGPSSAGLVDDLAGSIRSLPTDRFDGDPEMLSRLDLDQLVDGAAFDPWTWGLIGDALRDGGDGDASTLAALIAYQLELFEDPLAGQFAAANTAIYCADFSDVEDVWGCEGMPAANDLPVITAVDVTEPILVIGTEYDPSTPGRHAAELAAALGDATSMLWEGVGHTAYPVSACVDRAVHDLLVDGLVPEPGLRCPFLDDETTDAGIGDVLFGYPRPWIDDWLALELEFDGMNDREASCVARAVAAADHRTQTHVILDVTSDAATAALDAASATC